MDGSATQDDAVTRLPYDGDRDGEASATTGSTGILAQLQQLIGQVAAAPATREVAAKAAELAALAAGRAGPAARSLAARTEEVGQSVVERATTFATSMRTDDGPSVETSSEPATGGQRSASGKRSTPATSAGD